MRSFHLTVCYGLVQKTKIYYTGSKEKGYARWVVD